MKKERKEERKIEEKEEKCRINKDITMTNTTT